jgi:hypothetical protein
VTSLTSAVGALNSVPIEILTAAADAPRELLATGADDQRPL